MNLKTLVLMLAPVAGCRDAAFLDRTCYSQPSSELPRDCSCIPCGVYYPQRCLEEQGIDAGSYSRPCGHVPYEPSDGGTDGHPFRFVDASSK